MTEDMVFHGFRTWFFVAPGDRFSRISRAYSLKKYQIKLAILLFLINSFILIDGLVKFHTMSKVHQDFSAANAAILVSCQYSPFDLKSTKPTCPPVFGVSKKRKGVFFASSTG